MIDCENLIPQELKRDYHHQANSKFLWIRVLDLAYKDALWRFELDKFIGFKTWKRNYPALSWFMRNDDSVGSLNWICDIVDFYDSNQIRRKVLRLTIEESHRFDDIFSLMES